ncbi:hypothetical protein K1T71_005718 [Dendrolimus kikuchii]|uniref:Uncharacterized protein n=1 Tax=Dendrolimus kikuchii TaxID=765133 RepID=A0ACC1D4T5_9NEOP|nr:hypothetical protein K1T71_005718 [Dendrolimus kikuchii]
MDKEHNEVCDSQIISEHVGFLDNCFDNTFALQTSISYIKEFSVDVSQEFSQKKTLTIRKKINNSIPNKSASGQCSNNIYLSQNVNNKLRDWGLPLEIVDKYEARGIIEMFEWQIKCLANSRVLLDGCNLVYSAPTSAGKTLVAEILTIKTVLERQKKVIIILPFVSIVREKTFYLQDILSSTGIRVEGFMGSLTPPGGLQAIHIAICTIEKANSLVNKLLDDGRIWELGAVVVDELHLLGDPNRGYILELLLTKIKYISSKMNNVHVQIIGMSATLPNLEVLAEWLCAELFITQFRPIPLDEYCLVGNKFYDKNGKCISINGIDLTDSDSDNVLKICLETIKEGCSILIFCMTKSRCESVAQAISCSFFKLGSAGCEAGLMLRYQLNSEHILETLEQLKNCPVGLDEILKKTISFGVAYHHAGLTYDERDIIEGAFKTGAIRVLVATSTLSSGVNLPARKVIIRTPVFQRQPINIMTYKQMIGRAGRMGKDTKGESVLICTEAEKKIGFELMAGVLDPVKSCIESEDKYMRAVLEMIASQELCTKEELELYAKCTLLYAQQNVSASQNFLLDNTLKGLINFELVRIQDDGEAKRYIATPLGKACLSSSMAPNDGLSLFCELQKARQCLVLETDLHLIYLVTPYSVSSQWGDIDWLHLLNLWESLTKAMKRVGELVGVQESFIIRSLKGNNRSKNDPLKVNIHKRFYTALALQDLVNETPLSEVSTKFQCARGFLQSLQQAAATFAGMVTAFCRQLGWKNMEMLVSQFQDRLHFGIHSELIELMKLPSLNGARARTLFDSGYENISSIASADVNVIENILHKSVPFQSEKERDEKDSDDVRKRNKIRNVWITGCCGVTTREAAENLIKEARKYLQLEIGVTEIKWSNSNSDVSKSQEDKNIQQISSTILKEHSIANIQNAPELIEQNPLRKEKSIVIINAATNESCVNRVLINEKIIEKEEIIPLDSNKDSKKPAGAPSPSLVGSLRSNNSSPSLLKEDIVWDSLDFTEAAIENITKLRKTDKAYSPNISFGETNPSMMSFNVPGNISPSNQTSVKDISLFSSDGENISLFEESIPSAFVPNTPLDCENVAQSTKYEKTLHSRTVNTDSVLNDFKSPTTPLSVDEDDIKLLYEEDDNILDSSCLSTGKAIEVVVTQEFKDLAQKSNFKTPCKRQCINRDLLQPSSKTKRIENDKIKFNYDSLASKCIKLKMKCEKSKFFKLQMNEIVVDCYLLQGDDVLNNLHAIESRKEVAMYLNGDNKIKYKNEIGSNIIRGSNSPIGIESTSKVFSVNGVAFYIGEYTCLYFDLNSLNGVLLTVKERLKSWLNMKLLNLKILCLKTSYVEIKSWLGIDLIVSTNDISLMEWLIDSDEKIPSIVYLMKKYCNIDLATIPIKVDNQIRKFKYLDVFEDMCIKAWAIAMVSEKQVKFVIDSKYFQNTIDIEIKVSRILANCEFYGITVDKNLASRLLIDVRNSQDILQKKAYKLCGYNFNFNSSKEVAKALGMYKGRRVSTKKSVLSSHNTPMSSVVIYWRKLNSILTKTLYPLTEKACIYTEDNRINPTYTMFTCTGRVSMHEPNLQNVPRTFSIPSELLTMNKGKGDEGVIEFNCRNIFKAAPGYVMVSADYCQLEMRILTHFSADPVLMNIMNSDLDVFKAIAASWGNLPEEEVDDDLRQKAKQLCYGILYGMGNKTLAQHLDVSEIEAAMFMDSFYKTYPAVKAYTQRVIDECRAKGYVETLTRRRRYLPDINSRIAYRKSAAERQAVNTTIQGSAADIAKTAMCAIDARTSLEPRPRLILQMHDELIYEVPETNKQAFIRSLREVMENSIKLNVPLPVKVKCGYTWGSLNDVKI